MGAATRSLRLGTCTEHAAQGRALCLKRADGARQSALALRRQPHQYDTPIQFGGPANHRPISDASLVLSRPK